jgi:hypothetical protein
MLRVPGSINSNTRSGNQRNHTQNAADESKTIQLTEHEKQEVDTSTLIGQVKVIQEWNGQRPAIKYLLRDFRECLIQKKIDGHYQRQKVPKKYLPNDNNNSSSTVWIESNILQGNGISDYRKLTINLILAKYLINVKKYSYQP